MKNETKPVDALSEAEAKAELERLLTEIGRHDEAYHTQDAPIIADADKSVSELYDMIHPNASATATVRSLFVIDPAKKVRLIITYPMSTGRNFDEILRVIDSLQLTDGYKVATPVNWKKGEDVIIVPAVSNEDAKKLFPAGWKELKPYLRLVPDPKK